MQPQHTIPRMQLAMDDASLVVSGEVDMSNAHRVREKLLEAAERGGGALVLDVSGADYLDSAWFSAVQELAVSLGGRGGLRLVCAPDAPARRLLELSGIERMVPLHSSAATALGEG